jgi:hypothetical protein
MSSYAACPKCQNTEAKPIGFTWWGGVIGPKLLHHVKCLQCGAAYNGKTGKSNSTAIGVYLVVGMILAMVIGFALVQMRSLH